MFYAVETLLLGEGLAFSKHSAVIAAFGERLVKRGRVSAEYHPFLIEAQESRNVGDYDIGPGLSNEDAATQVDRATKVLELARRMIQ